MPIRSLLSETSFNTDQTEMIVKAFDDAWAKVQIDEAEPAMASLVRTALAKRILEMAHRPGVANQATTVMIRARAAITMIAHSVIQIANGTRRFRCMFGQIKRGEVFYTTQKTSRAREPACRSAAACPSRSCGGGRPWEDGQVEL